MSKTVKIVLIVIVSAVLLIGGSIGGLTYFVYTQAMANSCYALEMKQTGDVGDYTTDVFIQAFNQAGSIPLTKVNQDAVLYSGENTSNNVKAEVGSKTISVKNTEAIGLNNTKRQFVAEQMGVAIGASLGQNSKQTDSITTIATELGTALDAMQPYQKTSGGWDISFNPACSK